MVKENFEKLLIDLRIKPEDFGVAIGVGKSSIYKLLRGDTKKITRNFASKVHKIYPEISEEFLLSFNSYSKKNEAVLEHLPHDSCKEKKLSNDEKFIIEDLILNNEEALMKNEVFNSWFTLKLKKVELRLLKEFKNKNM